MCATIYLISIVFFYPPPPFRPNPSHLPTPSERKISPLKPRDRKQPERYRPPTPGKGGLQTHPHVARLDSPLRQHGTEGINSLELSLQVDVICADLTLTFLEYFILDIDPRYRP